VLIVYGNTIWVRCIWYNIMW